MSGARGTTLQFVALFHVIVVRGRPARNHPTHHSNFASRWRAPDLAYSGEWGYYPSGGLGLVLVVVLILVLMGRV